MRAVIQRVTRADVRVEEKVVGEIDRGWLVLLGVAAGDVDDDALRLADKLTTFRGFSDADDKMNLDVREIGGSILVVSQFTVLASTQGGRRPSFTDAAPPAEAERLYGVFVDRLRGLGLNVQTGVFRADMKVELINDGPVTFLLESRKIH
jgi:D-tyrosyl-tRNA(Tyr) deacylase